MIKVNTKMYLSDRLTAIGVESNMSYESILHEIINYVFEENLSSGEPIDTSKLLLITDDVREKNKIEVNRELTPYMNENQYVDVMSQFEFCDRENCVEIGDMYNVVVIGFLNCINLKSFTNIMNEFRSCRIFLFGDTLVDNQETGNFFMRYLTNRTLTMKTDYDDGRISGKKKINNLLMKLRKSSDVLFDELENNSVSINELDNCLIADDLRDALSDDELFIIVPKRIYGNVMSRVYESMKKDDSVAPKMGDVFYLRRDWIVKTNDRRCMFPAFTKVQMGEINSIFRKSNSRSLYIDADVFINGEMFCGVVIDYSDYLRQFRAENHPEEHELILDSYLEAITSADIIEANEPTIMRITPARIITCVDTKYIRSKKIRSYIETVERDLHYETDCFFYTHFHHALDEIEVFYSDEIKIY